MKLQQEVFDVVVIGGGASGIMAALVAGEAGKKVLILEKNKELGVKLKITGGGRCNITNAELDTRAFLSNFGKAADFLFSPFSQFGVQSTFDFFEARGLPLTVQARKRAFPKTEKALDVFKCLKRALDKNQVFIKTSCVVKKINHKSGKVTEIETNQGMFTGHSYILATGGVSHPETGSTGDGFKWLRDLGHSVQAPTPTIVPLAVEEAWVKILAGTALSFMKITFYLEGKKQFSKTGKVLFTHFGLSGPLILNCASAVAGLLQAGRVSATIDAYPDTDLGSLEKQIIKTFDEHKNKTLKTVFKLLVPAGTAVVLQTLLPTINFEAQVNTITKEERKKIVCVLKALPVTITNLMGYDRAVVADGGVTLTEVDTCTMRSRKLENLFITGDLLHINRPSGGYSLQLCWTTGYVAGKNA